MWISIINYGFYACAILFTILMIELFFLFILHFFVPKKMIETYFKEPYFSAFEIELFTGFPYAYMRTGMLMRLAGWPASGKKRGIPETAHETSPIWFQVVSRICTRISIIAFSLLIILMIMTLTGYYIVYM